MPSKVKDYQNRYKFPRRQRFMEFSAAFGDMSGPGTLAALPGTESLRVGHSGVEGPEVGRIASHTLQNPLLGVAIRAPVGSATKVGYGFRKGPTGTTVQEEETSGIYQPATGESTIVSAGVENIHLKSTEVVINDPGIGTMDFRVETDGNANGVFVDASANKVGILQGSPAEALDVVGNTLTSGEIQWKAGTANIAKQTHSNTAARTYTFPDKSGTVALLDDITSSGVWVPIKKTADETLTNNATLQADDHLVFTVAADTYVAFNGKIFFDTGGTGDFKFRLNNAAATPEDFVRFRMTWIAAGAIIEQDNAIQTAFHAGDIPIIGTGGSGWLEFDGVIDAPAKDTVDVQFLWAQNVKDGTPTTVFKGSYFQYMLIA